MPAPVTLTDFLDVCRKSGVVEETALSALSGSTASSPMAAAKALIRTGAITKFQAGQLLAGKYKGLRFDRLKILDRIGAGGMGTVFLCEHLGLRKQVAVKMLPPDLAGDEGTRERFFREARAAALLDHPNIVRVFDTNSTGGIHYIVMEYADGQDLQTMLNKYGPLPYTRACSYIAQAAQGLQHAFEKGLVHRDIKPGNLLVDKEGVVKILDMGLARFEEDDNKLTEKFDKGAVLGTADYMAPEQIMASSSVDIRADIYSLGATLYTLINGKPPFGGSCTQKLMGHQIAKATSLTEIRREVPKGLSAVVDRMMAKTPDERFQTPAEVLDALAPWVEMDTIPLDAQQTRKMPGTAIRKRKQALAVENKSKMPLVVTAVAVAAVLFGGLGVWALTGKDKPANVTAATGPESPQGAPPATAPTQIPGPAFNHPPPAPAPVAPSGPRLIYEIDFSRVPAFMAKFDDKKRTAMDGTYPPGWTSQSWRAGAVAEVGVQDHNGRPAVVMRTISGQGGSAELHTAHGASPYQFVAGKQYLLKTEYANVSAHPANFELRFDAERPPVKNFVRLHPTRGEWATAELRFTAPKHERVGTFYTHWAVAPEFLVIRSVQVFEIDGNSPAPTPSPAPPPKATVRPQVVSSWDFSTAEPFKGAMAKPGGLRMEQGRVPAGWNAYVWKEGSAGEVGLEEFAGKSGFAFRTTGGDPSAEIATLNSPPNTLKAGRRYRIDVEYAAPGVGGRMDVRLDTTTRPGTLQVRMSATGSAWKTASLDIAVPNDGDRPLRAFISNFGSGAENTLYVRTVTLTELVAGTSAAPAGYYRLSLAGAKVFARRHRLDAVVESQGDGDLPAPWAARTQVLETLGDVFIDPLNGQIAMGLRNHEGPPTTRLFTRSGLLTAKAGKRYAVKLTYQTEASGKGTFELAVNGRPVGRGDLPTVTNDWRDVEVTIAVTADGPLTMAIECGSVGSESSMYIKGIEVREIV
jgi:serine/threonine protein kinase